MAKPTIQNSRGFTLIELSIVLVIIASLVAMIMFSIQARMDAAKIYITKERMQMIADAIDRYVEIYGHIPCPADRVARTNANYGISMGDDITGTTCPAVGAPELFSGDVPARSLGLDTQMIADGWGIRFDYIIVKAYADADLFLSDDNTYEDEFEIRNQGDQNVAEDRDVAYTLISHGPNALGGVSDKNPGVVVLYAYMADAELANSASGLNVFYQSNAFLDDGKVFDDIVIYKTRWQFPMVLGDPMVPDAYIQSTLNMDR